MKKEQSSILTPNNKLVGVEPTEKRTKITKADRLETFSLPLK